MLTERNWIIAHRGDWWPIPEAQNSLAAIEAAFQAGYSVETDVRRQPDGRLVLSHDPLIAGKEYPPFYSLVDLMGRYSEAALFLNVKEPYTEWLITNPFLVREMQHRVYVFDFGLCNADPFAVARDPMLNALQLLKRVSDRVENESETASWTGTWMDQWDSDWVDPVIINYYKKKGPVFLVSPELHGRSLSQFHLSQWTEASGLCTDFPHAVQTWRSAL